MPNPVCSGSSEMQPAPGVRVMNALKRKSWVVVAVTFVTVFWATQANAGHRMHRGHRRPVRIRAVSPHRSASIVVDLHRPYRRHGSRQTHFARRDFFRMYHDRGFSFYRLHRAWRIARVRSVRSHSVRRYGVRISVGGRGAQTRHSSSRAWRHR